MGFRRGIIVKTGKCSNLGQGQRRGGGSGGEWLRRKLQPLFLKHSVTVVTKLYLTDL